MAAVTGPFVPIANFRVYITNLLGAGAFGTVYRGIDTNRNQTIAAKRIALTSHTAADNGEVAAFCNLNLEHGNIVNILHTVEIDRNLWVFMEYCSKGNLQTYFADHYLLLTGAKPKLHLMKGIANGLDFLHGEGIVHRDIKPENILINGRHEPELTSVKIGDFGLSKCLDPNGDTSGMSTDAGTSFFKSPEFWQRDAQGRIRYHKYVDIYAGGITFLAMLHFVPGNQLRAKENLEDMDAEVERGKPIGWIMYFREKHKQPRYNPIADDADDDQLTIGVKTLIRRLLQYVPEHRRNAEALVMNINELLQNHQHEGDPPTVLNPITT